VKTVLTLALIIAVIYPDFTEARIRLRKVKEAPKVCKVMQEDVFLSRDGKKVFGTLRHSLVFENSSENSNVSLVKDKGEKVCQWSNEDWNQVLKNNTVENLINFKYHIDEYKEILYPYAQKADGSYFVWSIPFKDCALNDQRTLAKLELPKCETPKKKSRKRSSKKKKKTG
jgi:hypothetical protein